MVLLKIYWVGIDLDGIVQRLESMWYLHYVFKHNNILHNKIYVFLYLNYLAKKKEVVLIIKKVDNLDKNIFKFY